MCLFIAMWFASGMVMMYVGFPELTQEEYYVGTEPLDAESITTGPGKLLEQVSIYTPLEQLLLSNSGKRPVYLMKLEGAYWKGMYADTGEIITDLSHEAAIDAALNFYQAQRPQQTAAAKHLKLLEMDQWSVSSGLDPYRPLHLVSLNDDAGTEFYVSSRTGQVVRDTSRSERVWNWMGSNLHWIYPVQLRKHRSLWVDVVILLALTSLVSVITGAIIGFMRLRFKRKYLNGSCSPYRGISKYHHILGLVALAFLTTFLLSGLMSMRPWGLFDSNSSFSEQRLNYQLDDNFSQSAPAYSQAKEIKKLIKQSKRFPVKQIAWHWIAGKPHVALYGSIQDIQYQSAPNDVEPLAQKIHNQIAKLIPDSNILSQKQLNSYDLYYYSHHNRHHPLPVLRVQFDDPEATWFHIDLSTGQILNRLTYRQRIERWVYNGFHSFDFPLLINHRPAWDLLMIILCGFGLIFSVTSVVVGVQYLRR